MNRVLVAVKRVVDYQQKVRVSGNGECLFRGGPGVGAARPCARLCAARHGQRSTLAARVVRTFVQPCCGAHCCGWALTSLVARAGGLGWRLGRAAADGCACACVLAPCVCLSVCERCSRGHRQHQDVHEPVLRDRGRGGGAVEASQGHEGGALLADSVAVVSAAVRQTIAPRRLLTLNAPHWRRGVTCVDRHRSSLSPSAPSRPRRRCAAPWPWVPTAVCLGCQPRRTWHLHVTPRPPTRPLRGRHRCPTAPHRTRYPHPDRQARGHGGAAAGGGEAAGEDRGAGDA